jgi:hypothetical protein
VSPSPIRSARTTTVPAQLSPSLPTGKKIAPTSVPSFMNSETAGGGGKLMRSSLTVNPQRKIMNATRQNLPTAIHLEDVLPQKDPFFNSTPESGTPAVSRSASMVARPDESTVSSAKPTISSEFDPLRQRRGDNLYEDTPSTVPDTTDSTLQMFVSGPMYMMNAQQTDAMPIVGLTSQDGASDLLSIQSPLIQTTQSQIVNNAQQSHLYLQESQLQPQDAALQSGMFLVQHQVTSTQSTMSQDGTTEYHPQTMTIPGSMLHFQPQQQQQQQQQQKAHWHLPQHQQPGLSTGSGPDPFAAPSLNVGSGQQQQRIDVPRDPFDQLVQERTPGSSMTR